MKICKNCGIEKELSFFQARTNSKNITYYDRKCKVCSREKLNKNQREWRKNNKQHIKEYNFANKDKAKARYLKYLENNKEQDKKNRNSWNFRNREKIKLRNKDKRKTWSKTYYLKNKEKINQRRTKNRSLKRKINISYRLRQNVSRGISRGLCANEGSKLGNSCMKFLPYSMIDLRKHLESQFEAWMNWDNYGIYRKNWNDKDQSTWTWQIDHIIPHSTFKYISMEDEEFKKCWALENLRPLSAKQNLLDGVSRARHRGL